ncbi:MAG: hypothetical protein ACE3L7_09555 [Candidatus Pristimantibacillus sp.]
MTQRTFIHTSEKYVRLFKLLIISALMLSATLFAYKAEGPADLHAHAEITNVTDNHFGTASRHHAAVKTPCFFEHFLLATVLSLLFISAVRTIPLSILRAFIPQKLKDLFLMPVKYTSNYLIRFPN